MQLQPTALNRSHTIPRARTWLLSLPMLVAAALSLAIDMAAATQPGVPMRPSAPSFPDPAERLQILTQRPAYRLGPAGSELGIPGPAVRGGRWDSKLAEPDRPQDGYDVRYSALDIDITDTAGRRVRGVGIHRIESRLAPLADAVFDLVDALTVDSVRVNGQPALFSHASDLVHVQLPTPLPHGQSAVVRIAYHGQPPQTGIGLRFDSHDGRPFVWNLSEPDGCRYWWPCKDQPDDKADSADVRITAPDWMTATSNGRLRSVQPGLPGTTVSSWHVSYAIAPYLVSVTAGNFARLDGVYPIPGGGTMPLAHYVFPNQVAAAQEDFNIAVPALNAFAARFGPYPFLREKYGISVFGWGGAMEHQTNTSYGWWLITGSHDFDWIYVHELGHQWWGDNVTCATWADTWLNEGFASWCEAIWVESQSGLDAYKNYMVQVQAVTDPSGPLYNFPDPFDGNTIYNKGAWAMHMLRGVLGDSTLFRALADYRALYQGRSVTTAQLQASLEASSHRDLDWFFNEWIYGMNRPHYALSELAETIPGGERLYLHLDQIQTDAGFFTMPVRVRVQAGGGHDFVLWNDPDHEDLVVDLPASHSSISVDPDNWILRTVASAPYGLNLVSAELPPVPADSFVAVPLVAKGGTTPYSWNTLEPAPPGITLDPQTGVLSGTPRTPGDYAFRVWVRDSSVPTQADTQRIRWSILPLPSDTSDRPGVDLASRRVRVEPNPAHQSVIFSLEVLLGSRVDWSMFDLSGRRLASARTSATLGSVQSWAWQGRDDRDRVLPGGLYLVRALETLPDGSRRTATGRVLLVR